MTLGIGSGVRLYQMRGTGLLLVSGLVFKSDFTNGMETGVLRRTGRSQAASCLVAPKIAIHGDFPLGVHHSISEIADFTP